MIFQGKNQVLSIRLLVFVVAMIGALFVFPLFVKSAPPVVEINNGKGSTSKRAVTLQIVPPASAVKMQVSNDASFLGIKWESKKISKQWTLDFGKGIRTVYVRFIDANNDISKVYTDTIILSVPNQIAAQVEINDNDETTDSRYVSLDIEMTPGIDTFWVSNSTNFEGARSWSPQHAIDWVLSPGDGKKNVYVKLQDASGATKLISDTITYEEPADYIPEATILKSVDSKLYYLGFDGKLHAFLRSSVYHSWFTDLSDIRIVSKKKLLEFPVGKPMCVRAGTWLVRFGSNATVYAVEPGCRLRPMRSEAETSLLYGSEWKDRILRLDFSEQSFYTVRTHSVADIVEGEEIIDRDVDGVDADTEKEYKTSDKNNDSDNDGLSDSEEINYWFSDPMVKDSDGDGYTDGSEIISRYSPTGVARITTISDDTYRYPIGAIVRDKEKNRYYYQWSDTDAVSLGKSSTGSAFKNNRLNSNFAIVPDVHTRIHAYASGSMSSKREHIYYPTVFFEKNTKLQ